MALKSVCGQARGFRRSARQAEPEWWYDWATQYGFLKTWRVDHEKTTLDMEKVSGVTLAELNLSESPKLRAYRH